MTIRSRIDPKNLVSPRWSVHWLALGLLGFYFVAPTVTHLFFLRHPYFPLLAALTIVACACIGIGFRLPLVDARFRQTTTWITVDSRLFHGLLWGSAAVIFLVTLVTAPSLPLWSALQGNDLAELDRQRASFLKLRTGWEAILPYATSIFARALLPYGLVLLFLHRSRGRYIALAGLLFYVESYLVKLLFIVVAAPLFYLFARQRRGLSIAILVLASAGLLYFNTWITAIGPSPPAEVDVEPAAALARPVPQPAAEAPLAAEPAPAEAAPAPEPAPRQPAATEPAPRQPAAIEPEPAEAAPPPEPVPRQPAAVERRSPESPPADSRRPRVLPPMSRADTVRGSLETRFMGSRYAPAGRLDYLVWRAFAVPVFTAADSLLVFEERYRGEYFLGATSNLLSKLLAVDRIPFEAEVFAFQWNPSPYGRSNSFYAIEAYVNFGWPGVVLFSLIIGQGLRLFHRSPDEAFKAPWLLFAFFVSQGGLIGTMLSNGFALLFLVGLFVAVRPHRAEETPRRPLVSLGRHI